MVELFRVGGSVRDELLGLKPKDIDYTVVADSFADMEHWLVDHQYNLFLSKPEYGTIRAISPEREVADFVLARKDGYYSDGRHPDSVQPGSLYDDLARRDFTVNAMARRSDGALIDPFGGFRDLQQRKLRTVGRPEDRILEDPLRALRAIRFEITRGMNIQSDLAWVLRTVRVSEALHESVSAERIREEMDKMFRHNQRATLAIFMHRFPNILEVVLDRGLWLKPTLEEK